MIWTDLLSNALWIAALALALAVVGYAHWRGGRAGASFRAAFRETGPRFWLNLAGLLFSLGLALSGLAIWLRLLWLLPAGWFAARMPGSRQQRDNSQRQDHGAD